MNRKIVSLILLMLITATVVFADGWPPEWLFTPYWPPGEYPVWSTPGGALISIQEPTTISTDGSPIGDPVFYSATCMDSACNEILVSFMTFPGGGWGEMPYNQLVIIKRADWTPLLDHTPTASLPTPSTSVPTIPPIPPTATPAPTSCPSDVIQQATPRTEKVGAFPPHPVVRGQGGQGLSITLRAISFPVIRHYWIEVNNSRWACVHVETGFVDDGRYGVSPCSAGWPGWEMRWIEDRRCEERIEIIPDPIQGSGSATARLRESSKRWIEGELQQRYPGARVRRPDWNVPVRVLSNGCAADGRCIMVSVAHFPFEDPGWYDIRAQFQTTGTPYTPPRAFEYRSTQPQAVYLMDSTLLPNW